MAMDSEGFTMKGPQIVLNSKQDSEKLNGGYSTIDWFWTTQHEKPKRKVGLT